MRPSLKFFIAVILLLPLTGCSSAPVLMPTPNLYADGNPHPFDAVPAELQTNHVEVLNYTYVDYVGRSTFKGYPGTDRESPALVAEAMTELKTVYPISKYFVGGHSQGGFLTYSLLMNFPEEIAGAFPISAGVIFQCEPSAYADEKVKAAQRAVPLAIVHSRSDRIVNYSSAELAATQFNEANWHAFHFFTDDLGAGHMFGLLPVHDAIRWLEIQSSDDPKKLLDFAQQHVKAADYRDAISALNRAATLKLDATSKTRLDQLMKEINTKSATGAKDFLEKIQANTNSAWIDPFLAYRDQFEFAPGAADVMKAFQTLRAQQEQPATQTMSDARSAFQTGQPDQGYDKYREVTENYYAASQYRNAKRWLDQRR